MAKEHDSPAADDGSHQHSSLLQVCTVQQADQCDHNGHHDALQRQPDPRNLLRTLIALDGSPALLMVLSAVGLKVVHLDHLLLSGELLRPLNGPYCVSVHDV